MARKKLKVVLSVLSFVAALAVFAPKVLNRSTNDAKGRDDRNLPMEKVESRSLTQVVELTGEVKPALSTPIRSEVSGLVAEVCVLDGQRVDAGQVLVTIDQKVLNNQKASTELRVESSRLRAGQARRDYERTKDLFERKFVSERENQTAETAWKVAENELRIEEKALEGVMENLAKTKVKAPHSGCVIRLQVVPGQAITGVDGVSGGTELMEVVDLSRLAVSCEAGELDACRLAMGLPARIGFDAVPDVSLKGKIRYVSPAAVTRTQGSAKVFPVEAACDSSDARVKPGLTARVSVPIAAVTNVPSTTLAAVFSEGTNRVVFVRRDRGFEKRSVTTGAYDLMHIEIRTGLNVGDVVALKRPADRPGP